MIPVLTSLGIKKNEAKSNIYLEAISLFRINISKQEIQVLICIARIDSLVYDPMVCKFFLEIVDILALFIQQFLILWVIFVACFGMNRTLIIFGNYLGLIHGSNVLV